MTKNGSLSKIQFVKVEGPVRRDVTTYFVTEGELFADAFANMRRNAAAVISVAIGRLVEIGEIDIDAQDYADEVRGQKHDVRLTSTLFEECMTLLREGCAWVMTKVCELRERDVQMLAIVKLALIARLIAARSCGIVGYDEADALLELLLVGRELGPVTVDDTQSPLRAPTWNVAVGVGGDVTYTSTYMADYGSQRRSRTVWVRNAAHPRDMAPVIAALRIPIERIGFHVDGRYDITHFNVYDSLKEACDIVARNMATEIVTTGRRYNTSCPGIYVLDASGELKPYASEEMRAMHFFRACDLLPSRLASEFTRRVEAGHQANGFTMIGAYRKWRQGALQSKDAVACANAGGALLDMHLGPYDLDEVERYMSEYKLYVRGTFQRYEQVAYDGPVPDRAKHTRSEPVVDKADVEATSAIVMMLDESSMPEPASALEGGVDDVEPPLEDAPAPPADPAAREPTPTVHVVPMRVPRMDDYGVLRLVGVAGCAKCTQVYCALGTAEECVFDVTCGMLPIVIPDLSCPWCASSDTLRSSVEYGRAVMSRVGSEVRYVAAPIPDDVASP